MFSTLILTLSYPGLFFLQFSAGKINEAINCKSFSSEEAKFAAETFYKIPLSEDIAGIINKNVNKIIPSANIVENFIKNLKNNLLKAENKEIEKETIQQNARNIVTIATDLCNKMPQKEYNGLSMSSDFVKCVEFLFYQHMQRLVWRLMHKWGINWQNVPLDQSNLGINNSLLNIYTEKKANALQKMTIIYRNEFDKFLEGQSEKIRQKFEYCLVIEDETRLRCEPINSEDALFFVEYFYKIPISALNFEQNKGQKTAFMATNILNSLKLEHRKCMDELEEENANYLNKKVDELRRWRQVEPAIKVRIQILVNIAEEKCQKLRKNPINFLKRMGAKIGETFKKSAQILKVFKQLNDDENEMDSNFVTCIYHYLYAFSLNLIENVEAINYEPCHQCHSNKSDQKQMKIFRKIYKNLRKKMWKTMKTVYVYLDGLDQMNDWLENALANDDPFKNCANVIPNNKSSLKSTADDVFTKSFDDHLMMCVSQFLEAVASDQFKYYLFVNFYSKQLDSKIEFPDQLAKKDAPNAKDNCYFMREVLNSLNKSITNRLNFEKITKRSEKDDWVKLHEKLEDLLLKQQDQRWTESFQKNLNKNDEILRNANSIKKHPIRDQYQKLRERIRKTTKGDAKVDKTFSSTNGGRKKRAYEIGETSAAAGATTDEDEPFSDYENANDIMEFKNNRQIDPNIIKIAYKIAQHPVGKRIEVYANFYKAFNIALALELFDRLENGGLINLPYIFGHIDETAPAPAVSMKDRLNVEKIKKFKNLQIFDQIGKRMGKKLTKTNRLPIKFMNKKLANREETMDKRYNEVDKSIKLIRPIEVGHFVLNEQQILADKVIGLGFELGHLGYSYERDGSELLATFMEEMKLNMDQFGISWDTDCDITDGLNQCLMMASDELDFDAQLFRFSLLGKQSRRDQMGTLEKAVESLFKKLNRSMYKFGHNAKRQQNLLERFYNVNIHDINEGLAPLMGGQISPFEDAFYVWLIKLFNSLNATFHGNDKGKRKVLETERNIETAEMAKLSLQIFTENQQINERINVILNKIVEQAQQDMQNLSESQSHRRINKSSKEISSKRKKREIIAQGASITVPPGIEDSKMFNSHIIDSTIPGLRLHWLHAADAPPVLIGNDSLLMDGQISSALLFTFNLIIVDGLVYWRHAVKLAVYMAVLHGHMIGWAILFIAAAFYILTCIMMIK